MRTRQAVALGAGLLVLILLVFGVKGCLDSRNERALKDYTRDASSIIADSNDQVAKPFFELLSSGQATGNDLQVQVNQIRLTAEEDAKRARELSVPDAMRAAQQNLLLTLDLRAQALTRIAEKLPAAQGRGQQAEKATSEIAGQMQMFLTSDVVYSQRAAPLIVQALDEAGISGQSVPASQSLPGYTWLAPETVANAIGGQGGGTTGGTVAPGLHGHGIVSTAIGDTTLQPDGATNRIASKPPVTVTVKFANQGDNNEKNVTVTLSLAAPGQAPITAKKTVNATTAGTEAEVAIPLTKVPPAGTASELTVKVAPVPGEENTDNNTATYTVLFTG